MNTFLILLAIALLVVAFVVLAKHRRNVRHHRFTMGMIGSDPLLTQTLHNRMLQQQPDTDWLNPHVMRAKIAAWRSSSALRATESGQCRVLRSSRSSRSSRSEEGGVIIDVVLYLAFAAALWLLCGLIGRWVLQTGSF